MDAEENQRQVFLRAHSPWKSQTTRFPHSHSRCSAWKSGKPKAGFPLSHLLSLLFNQIKKGNPAADRFAPASRLILQLENAVLPLTPWMYSLPTKTSFRRLIKTTALDDERGWTGPPY